MVVQEIRRFSGSNAGRPAADAATEYVSFRDIWSFLRRHILILALMTLLGALLGMFYISKTEPTYSAIARLVIDYEPARIASQDVPTGTIIIEAAEIASEVEIVKSEAIARSVIQQLNLTEDPEIRKSTSWRSAVRGAIASFLGLFSGSADDEADAATQPDEEDIMRRTMAAFLSRVWVRRVGQSYVLEIGYTSTDPVKAARAANAIANTYMQQSIDAKSEIVTRGATWIEDRLAEIGRQAHEAAMNVEQFRNSHDIARLGTASTLDHQRLSEISSQLLTAQANTFSEAASLATINRLLVSDVLDGYVGEALNNTEINRLRGELRPAKVKLETLRDRYGQDGGPTRAIEEDIARLEGEIRQELVRIQGVHKSNLETARQREQLLQEQLDGIKNRVSETNIAQVELAELESRATTYRRMYESVLQQLITTLQKQSFPIGDARMVTAATPPLSKIWPKTTLIIPFSLMVGFAGGIGLAGVRDLLDRRISSGERLGRELGLPALGQVPFTRFKTMPIDAATDMGMVDLPEEVRSLRYVLDEPYSGFSEALRSVKNSVDATFPASGAMIVGVTSVEAGEGKSTIATNLAQLYLNEGISVILVDASFASPHLSRLAQERGEALGIAVSKPPTDENAAVGDDDFLEEFGAGGTALREKGAKLHSLDGWSPEMPSVPVLTVDQTRAAAHPHHHYGHLPALKQRLEELREHYRVIIVDLAAFANSVDARVASTYLDGILLVLGGRHKMTVEWLADALATFGKSRVGIVGVIFNHSAATRPRFALSRLGLRGVDHDRA